YKLFDNDPAANGRYYFYYFDSGKNYLGNYYGVYTSDNTIWQILSGEYVIPETAYYIFVGFRFYDTSSWDGDAYIYIDSVYFGNEGGSPVDPPPQFSSPQRIPSNPAPSETVYTSIIITDNSAVISDTMFYRLDTGTWNPIIRDSLVLNRYYYTLSGQVLGTDVDYYYKAIDDSSLIAISDTFHYTVSSGSGVGLRILFDFTKEEDAGNADWIIDTNYPKPLPDNPTAEDDWLGAISHWGFELDTSGYVCRTLPPTYSITYGTLDSMDLQNFDVFIIPEPQNPFSASEKSAIFDFVRDGGGLFMVADHNASDRNSSGWDSPRVFNDLGSKDSFGMHFDTTGESYNSITAACTFFTGLDSIYNGKYGNVQGSNFTFHAGTTMPASTKAIEIAPYPFDASYSMLSVAYFGNGKVAGMGDSSPADDSTGQAGNTLYMGWEDGINRMLIMNTSWWLSINNITSQINSIYTNYEIINDKMYIHLNLTNSSEFINIRLYKKCNNNNYTFIDSKPSNNIIMFEDDINNNHGIIYYKITGIKKDGRAVFLDKIKIIENVNTDIINNVITN
ncbi:hypothetical protein KAU15_03935, partial [candidate division WOR-3 bacterium]|nr:hypothetical protein [candidate division WOR-3 bacterium]